MPSFPLQVTTNSASNNGINVIVTNNYKTVAQAQTHGEQRGAVVRVVTWLVQNNGATNATAQWSDSSGAALVGPFVLGGGGGNWTQPSSSFIFETTRSNSTPFVGYDLTLVTNSVGPFVVDVTWTYSFVPGRVTAS